jgi:hypothetical protein
VRQWYPWRATALSWRGVPSDIMAEQYVWAAHLHFVKEQNLDCQIEFAESQREMLLQAVMEVCTCVRVLCVVCVVLCVREYLYNMETYQKNIYLHVYTYRRLPRRAQEF